MQKLARMLVDVFRSSLGVLREEIFPCPIPLASARRAAVPPVIHLLRKFNCVFVDVYSSSREIIPETLWENMVTSARPPGTYLSPSMSSRVRLPAGS